MGSKSGTNQYCLSSSQSRPAAVDAASERKPTLFSSCSRGATPPSGVSAATVQLPRVHSPWREEGMPQPEACGAVGTHWS